MGIFRERYKNPTRLGAFDHFKGKLRISELHRTDTHKHVQILPGENFISEAVRGLLPRIMSYSGALARSAQRSTMGKKMW